MLEMTWMIYLAYASIGALAGVMAGLLGIGGGVITVPCLFFLFTYLKMPQPHVMQIAIGTSLAAMILNTASSTWAQNKKKSVLWELFKKIYKPLVIGGFIGAFIADRISGVILEIIFGSFLCMIGIIFLRHITPHFQEHRLPANPLLFIIFSIIGILSVVLGLSGGVFTFPALVAFQIPQKKAVGTSSAVACLMTTIGTIALLYLGLSEVSAQGSIGYIHIPAFLIIGIISFLCAPFGVYLTHQLSDKLLRKIFGCVLILTGVLMLI